MTTHLAGQTVRRFYRHDRLNIQRAQSAVLVKKDGVEYAIVSDDNYAFLDPYWKAMYEAPSFIHTPLGTPMAVGGSASARRVNVGGKLGIVKDPFGTAEYLGATMPFDGYGIINLSLSEDGKVLIGQFKGGYSGNMSSPFWNTQLPSANAAWNVDNLIDAALGQPAQDRLSKHINLPPDTLINVASPHPGQPVGTDFDPAPPLAIEGRMGDIIEVDLKLLLAQALSPQEQLTITGFKDFKLDAADIRAYADDSFVDNPDAYAPFKLVTVDGRNNHDLYSRNGSQTADFLNTGRMYLAPKLTTNDITKLRNGERIAKDKQATLSFSYQLRTADGEWIAKHASVKVTAKDIAQVNTFFGDRPLDNPGYSEFKLMNGVAANSINDVLDVYRVEQRLAYLGFPAMYTGNPRPRVDNNVIQNFTVDGWFGSDESAALKLFEKVVRYDLNHTVFANRDGTVDNSNGADGMIESSQTDAKRTLTLQWLNAYNAPHWMQLFASTGNPTGAKFVASDPNKLPGWENRQTGTRNTNVEVYGTSWMYDLMVAKQFAPTELRQTNSWFNGAVDANYGFTPTWNPQPNVKGQHKTHDLGMAFDLGVSNNIFPDVAQANDQEQLLAAINALAQSGWSLANAVAYTEHTLASGETGLPNIQSPARERNDQVAALRDFLSLYALTQTDGITAELQASTVNTTAANLFGGMITGVHIGGESYQKRDAQGNLLYTTNPVTGQREPDMVKQNPYRNINKILEKLDISSSTEPFHQSHFHIYLKPPAPQELQANLLAELSGADSTTTNLIVDPQVLLEYVQTLITGEELMFAMDVPYIPATETPVMLAAAATPSAELPVDFILNECQETEHTKDPRSALRGVDPAGMLAIYLSSVGSNIELKDIKITMLQGAKHGNLTTEVDNTGLTFYGYDPNPGFLGDDQAVFLAEYGGKRFKIVLVIKVLDIVVENDPLCPDPVLIKAPTPNTNGSGISSNNNLASAVTFVDLGGGALGKSDLTGITLDDNANGYAWYIDLTPGLNDEFLPTSNPYEWIAKPGSDAEGKMDLLTVLLHEAAHSLGLDHTADAHTLMAPTLQPGVRRLPSPELLAELQWRSNDDLLATAALTPALSQGERENPAPAPLPLGIGFTAFWAGRMRKSGFGYAFESNERPAYDVAPNPTLLNTEFAGNSGWNTTGQVTFGSNAAVLTESPVAQTRLNQLFTLGAHDRFLRFTLDNLNGFPDDVLEIALLNTNTGSVIRD